MTDHGCTIPTRKLTHPNLTFFKVEPKGLTTGPKIMIYQGCTITIPNLT